MAAPVRQISRHLVADGRQSLRQHVFGGGAHESFLSQWVKTVKRKELVPLIGAVGGAVVMGGWFAQRHLFMSPNVHVNKSTRKATINNSERKAVRFATHRDSMRKLPGVQLPTN